MMNKVRLRRAEAGDEEILAYIQSESWKSAFSGILPPEVLKEYTDRCKLEAMYQRVLCQKEIRVVMELVAEKPHCIAAWSKSRDSACGDAAELICIHSLPDGRRRGYGSVVLRAVLEEMAEHGYAKAILWVFAENTDARKFYEKHGFQKTDRRQNHFGSMEIMYEKILEIMS